MKASNSVWRLKHLLDTSGWLIALILVWAIILRLYGLDFSFSNDELSALSRTTYDNFGALVRDGVMADFHPALVQFFLFIWTSVVPASEIAIRIPFVLLGVGSIVFVYLVSRAWFGSQTALLTAASMAGLQYFILYSQLARPYSPGLFFTWWMLYHWTRLLQEKGGYKDALLGGLATALAMYTHYFSFMQVMLISLLGLVWMNRRIFRYYAIAGATAFLIWLPHLTITLHHLGKGGVGTWLGAPEPDFIWSYLLFVFNDSSGVLILLVLVGLVGLSFSLPNPPINRWQLACLVLFAVPFAIGYYYSRLVNPVLQYSTLLFAAPLILIFVFSFAGTKMPKGILAGLVLLILSSTTYSTVVINRYYFTESFGVFRELAEKIKEWDEQYGAQNIVKAANLNSPGYLEHYFKQLDHPIELKLYNVSADSNHAALRKILRNSRQEYMAFAWSTHHVPLEAYLIIRDEYPYLVESAAHFNSGAYLFSRSIGEPLHPTFSFNILDNLDSEFVQGVNPSNIDTTSSQLRYHMPASDQYALNWESRVKPLPIQSGDIIVASADVRSDPKTEMTMVIEVIPVSGEKKWYGKDLYPAFSNLLGEEHQLHAALRVERELQQDDLVKIYIWKRSNSPIAIESFNVAVYPDLIPEPNSE